MNVGIAVASTPGRNAARSERVLFESPVLNAPCCGAVYWFVPSLSAVVQASWQSGLFDYPSWSAVAGGQAAFYSARQVATPERIDHIVGHPADGMVLLSFEQESSGRVDGSGHVEYLTRIPFRVTRPMPAVLIVGLTANYGCTGLPPNNAVWVADDKPPRVVVSITSQDGTVAGFISITFPSAPPIWPGYGPYVEVLRTTVWLDPGTIYRLDISHEVEAGWTNEGHAFHIEVTGGGGTGVGVTLIANRTTVPPVPLQTFFADVNGDGVIDDADLLAVLSAFGSSCTGECVEDIDGSGIVDDGDILAILVNYGFEY
ncbi:MAG: hypothetical protein ABDI19_12085 [Armatimonadota bacterium]